MCLDLNPGKFTYMLTYELERLSNRVRTSTQENTEEKKRKKKTRSRLLLLQLQEHHRSQKKTKTRKDHVNEVYVNFLITNLYKKNKISRGSSNHYEHHIFFKRLSGSYDQRDVINQCGRRRGVHHDNTTGKKSADLNAKIFDQTPSVCVN